MKSMRLLNNIGSNLQLKENENGMKIVQLRVTNEESDFKKYCSDPIRSKAAGISVEELVKSFGLSILVARDKLDRYVKNGKLVVDSSLEGVRYYLNDIITCDL